MSTRLDLSLEWTAPPPETTPKDMVFCKKLGFNIHVCKMFDNCHIKKCKAKEVRP